jgi:hypothetical protein
VSEPQAIDIGMTDDELVVRLADGRTVSVPLIWFPRILYASAAERADFRIIGGGEYINWPALNEDLSVSGLLRGSRSAGN